MTVKEYRATIAAPKKKSKYNNVRTERHGIKFDSKKEAGRYDVLLLLQNQGLISGLEVHRRYILEPAFVDTQGKKHRAEYYEGDFSFFDYDSRKWIVEDVKGRSGTRTALFESKRKRFIHRYPEYEFRIIE